MDCPDPHPYLRDPGYVQAFPCADTSHGYVIVYDMAGGGDKIIGKQEGVRWVIVHQPSRNWQPGKSRDKALQRARAIAAGVEDAGIVVAPQTPPAVDRPTIGLTMPPSGSARAPAREGTESASNALRRVFTNERLIELAEEAVGANRTVRVQQVTMEGKTATVNIVEPDHQTRLKGLQFLVQMVDGTPTPKKEHEQKKGITADWIFTQIDRSPEFRDSLRRRLEDAEKKAGPARVTQHQA